jgi:hypothetical protein
MTTTKKGTAEKPASADFPPEPLPKDYDHWDDGAMSMDADQLLRRMFVQFENQKGLARRWGTRTAPRLIATLEFWKEQFATGKVPGKPVISPERMHRFVGDERDFALVRDKDGKPVDRDDPRNAELKNAGPKKKTKK